MALSFLTSSEQTIKVVVTCDTSIKATEEERTAYLSSGDLDDLGFVGDDATKFTLKALSPSEREEAEVKAGAYTRSELGRLLWVEAPSEIQERARWHHALTDDERQAMSDYQAYLSRVYLEMVSASLTLINGEAANVETVNNIRPDSNRVQTISELVMHIQRISLLGIEGK
tara:strand:- start:41 stop:553 length:513 start_codon:yes stop_codon:yes gene_type:complete